jgi:hypothetical protein
VPAPGPSENSIIGTVIRAVWDELHRISTSMFQLDMPDSITVSCEEDIATSSTAAPVYHRLFDLDATIDIKWERPEGTLDEATGIFTFQSDGLFQISGHLLVPPFDQPGVRNHYCSLRFTLVRDGYPDEVGEIYGSGSEQLPVSASGMRMAPVLAGNSIYFEAAIVNEVGTTNQTVQASISLFRVSAIR